MKEDPLLDLEQLKNVPAEKIPAVLAQLAAAQGLLAARLLQNGGNESHHDAGERGKLLDVNEAAKRIGKSADWLYRNSEKLPFTVRVGRSVKFSEAGLEKWIRLRSGRN